MEEDFNINLTPRQIASFKYVPISSCDMEYGKDSQYKSILRSNRRLFGFKNLKKHYYSQSVDFQLRNKVYFIYFFNRQSCDKKK